MKNNDHKSLSGKAKKTGQIEAKKPTDRLKARKKGITENLLMRLI